MEGLDTITNYFNVSREKAVECIQIVAGQLGTLPITVRDAIYSSINIEKFRGQIEKAFKGVARAELHIKEVTKFNRYDIFFTRDGGPIVKAKSKVRDTIHLYEILKLVESQFGTGDLDNPINPRVILTIFNEAVDIIPDDDERSIDFFLTTPYGEDEYGYENGVFIERPVHSSELSNKRLDWDGTSTFDISSS